jgi:hypothetical protein
MTTRSTFSTLALGVIIAGFGLAGCNTYKGYYPGGGYTSRDRFTYESTSWMPQTVTVRDTRTGEDLWSIDVPVGKKVVVWFKPGLGPGQPYPDAMEWALFDLDVDKGPLPNMVGVPSADARLVIATLRPAPEMPGETLAPEDYVEPAPLPAEAGETAEAPPPSDDDPAILTPEEAGEDG